MLQLCIELTEAVEIRITSVKTSDVEQRDVGLVADLLKDESERVR